MIARWSFCVALVAFGLAWSADVQAFCRSTTCKEECVKDDDGCPSGAPVRWESSCVGISIDTKGSALLDRPEIDRALRDAMRAWNDADCGGGRHPSIQLLQVADVECGHADYVKRGPNANVVHFRDESWDGARSQDVLALTTLRYGTSSADIHDADIAVNTANKRFALDNNVAGGFDLRVVLTHELGHLLGIGHSENKDATMYAGVETGDASPRTLSADDVAAICAAYPPNEVRACTIDPEGGLGGCEGREPPHARCSAAPAMTRSSGSGHGVIHAAAAIGLMLRVSARGRSRAA
jgi:hypothetical protein